MQLPWCPGKQGELSKNCLHNLRNDLMADSALRLISSSISSLFLPCVNSNKSCLPLRKGDYPAVRPAAAPPMRADRGTATREGGGYNGYGIALSPMQNDLLALGVKADGEEGYNMHEIPMVDGE